jgi:cytochrome c peroxidase
MLQAAVLCGGAAAGAVPSAGVPPEVMLGERLSLETRFAEPFGADQRAGGNAASAQGAAPSAAARGISCRTCHLVDELQNAHPGAVRSYTDFSARSTIAPRDDGLTTTVRNSPTMVDVTVARRIPLMLHYDGEFASREELVRATLTGRNFGWRSDEHEIAVAHIAAVIRGDDGQGGLARQYGGIPYRVALSNAGGPVQSRLGRKFQLDTAAATDRQILDAVARLIAAYMDSLRFATDAAGRHSGSPYDLFLARNALPQAPAPGESDTDYGRRLRASLVALGAPRFVTGLDGRFRFHAQDFRFGPTELAGLKIFLTESAAGASASAGNCVSCHAPPDFTDFSFHNTGVAQTDYDAIHGPGAFSRLPIPDLAQRNAAPQRFLPPSPAHPRAAGPYRSVPAAGRPGLTDLGVWNVLGNPDLPAPQAPLRMILCGELSLPAARCSAPALLPLTVGMFKTPTLRDLGQSGPYLHTGSKATVEDVLHFYTLSAALARQGRLRNADRNLARIALHDTDIPPLAAFLRSLNEDYREVRGVRNLAARRLLWSAPQGDLSGVIAALSRHQVQVTLVSSTAAAAQAGQGKFTWVVIDCRGQGGGNSPALRQAVRRLRATHIEIPILIFGDAHPAPQLRKDAAQFGLTLAGSPQALLSGLIAVRPQD